MVYERDIELDRKAMEDQIERIAEREMNRLDREYMKGMLSEAKYKAEVAELEKWCREEYRERGARLYREP